MEKEKVDEEGKLEAFAPYEEKYWELVKLSDEAKARGESCMLVHEVLPEILLQIMNETDLHHAEAPFSPGVTIISWNNRTKSR